MVERSFVLERSDQIAVLSLKYVWDLIYCRIFFKPCECTLRRVSERLYRVSHSLLKMQEFNKIYCLKFFLLGGVELEMMSRVNLLLGKSQYLTLKVTCCFQPTSWVSHRRETHLKNSASFNLKSVLQKIRMLAFIPCGCLCTFYVWWTKLALWSSLGALQLCGAWLAFLNLLYIVQIL